MKYTKFIAQSGIVHFHFDSEIALDDFKRLMRQVATGLGAPLTWTAIPEAEVGKITTNSGCIYAKLDFGYGLEFACENVSAPDMVRLESMLSRLEFDSDNRLR